MTTFLTTQEVADRYQVSTRTIERLVVDRRIPFAYFRHRVRFPLADLEIWERTRVIPARN